MNPELCTNQVKALYTKQQPYWDWLITLPDKFYPFGHFLRPWPLNHLAFRNDLLKFFNYLTIKMGNLSGNADLSLKNSFTAERKVEETPRKQVSGESRPQF